MNSPVFLSFLAPFLNHFVQYKRALNRKYRADAEVLRLFDRYLHSRHIAGWSAVDGACDRRLSESLAPALAHAATTIFLESFIASSPSPSCSNGYNGIPLLPLLALRPEAGFHICSISTLQSSYSP
jgi:hypothetical protein